MSAYFQMGHDTENLIGANGLDDYTGIILSPVNRDPSELKKYIEKFRKSGDYEIILDSQLYLPRSLRGKLSSHPYFPSDIDSTDPFSESWWDSLVNKLTDYALELGVDTVCSPTILPKTWTSDFFLRCDDISAKMMEKLSSKNIKVLSTVMANLSSMSEQDFVLEIASTLTRTHVSGHYIVIISDVEPRNEFSDASELFGIMSLIKELKNSGFKVIVSHCSSDMILFRVAGASHCATGKFFNLRRFTKSRFEEPGGGGGQLAYWFEHSLLAFIRETDLLRIMEPGFDKLVKTFNSNNHWADTIVNHLKTNPGEPWVKYGWRQYLSWFGKTEKSLENINNIEIAKTWLKEAEDNWLNLEDNDILFDEARNNGNWIRPWRQAIIEFGKRYP